MIRFAATIFLSAFLLFQVQPLIGKYILPWFGGSPAVWTTCMLLFQVLLLVGYAYAHLVSVRLTPRAQGIVHLALLALSLVLLPIVPDESWKPLGTESPTWRILLLLTTTIGMPYFLLSSTGPLLQRWFSYARPGVSPYRLYALSNVGSLLALLSYPLVVEPALKLGTQAAVWSLCYAVFAGLCGVCAFRLAVGDSKPCLADVPDAASAGNEIGQPFVAAAPWGDRLLWLALATCGSVLLLATTNQMCQEVAVVPFLWIVPLALYLLSFILCFDSQRWYHRGVWGTLLAVCAAAACLVLDNGPAIKLPIQLGVYSVTLLAACMVCHGELVRAKPHPRELTLFYLIVAAGGALGGVLVALVAPRVFTGYWEYHVALAGCCLLALVAWDRDPRSLLHRGKPLWAWTGLACALVVLIVALSKQATSQSGDTLAASRNFYGLLRVDRRDHDSGPQYTMAHGRIVHGVQCLDEDKRRWPTAYFGPGSGVELAIEHHPHRAAYNPADAALRIGVIGLGAGTIAVYGRPDDYLRFYEINPDVIELAGRHFTFLADCPARVDLILGDARIQLERELQHGQLQQFDVLIADAFSGDAIPMHLLTRECFRLYWEHLKPDGILVVNVSNNNVDVTPVVRGLADELGLETLMVCTAEDAARATNISDWLLVTRNRQFLAEPAVAEARVPWPAGSRRPFVWTDDYGSLRQVLRK